VAVMKQKVIVILGPTSSGKSALAVSLAKKFNGEVVSADSRQVYRGLDIGTGKITRREMKSVPHHLLDVANPKKVFTAHDFVKRGRAAVADIMRRGKLPIVAGGTGFYIDALLGRIVLPDVPVNKKLRKRLEKMSAAELFAMLRKKDSRRAKEIDPKNPHRLIRALEIAEALGKVPRAAKSPLYDVLWIGIETRMDELEKKIKTRLRARIRQGMIAEAKQLRKSGLSFKRMDTLGLEYRALARHLQGETTRALLIAELDRELRHFTKRQLTYWKRNADIKWFPLLKTKEIQRSIEKFVSR
jgi:tRNA dimethylallyltransferase